MPSQIARLFSSLVRNLRDLAIIAAILVLFQFGVVQEPLTATGEKLLGAVLIVCGLTLFLAGLSLSLFPLGERLAEQFARRGSLGLLLLFAFGIGFGSTVVEPALIAVTDQAAAAIVADSANTADGATARTAMTLRLVTAIAVGLSVVGSCVRIIRGWPAFAPVIALYSIALLLVILFPTRMAGIAFDASAAATSAINIPLIAAIGIGLATVIEGRSPLTDGFGTVALASAVPIVTVLAGILILG